MSATPVKKCISAPLKDTAAANGSSAAASNAPAAADIVQQINGNFGRWQLRTMLLIFLCKIPAAWFAGCVIYTAPTPQKGEYFCKPLAATFNGSANSGSNNGSVSISATAPVWVRMSHPVYDARGTDRRFRVDACHIYEEQLQRNFAARYNNYTNPFAQPEVAALGRDGGKAGMWLGVQHRVKVNVIPCEHFEHNSDYISLVTQFDLVCSRQLLVSVTQSFHALGGVLGGLLSYKALKHMSPHRLMFVGMLAQICCGSLTGLVNTFQLHVYFRCLTSLFCVFMVASGQVILTDITAGRARTIVTTLSELFWGIGLVLLPAISIFFDSWSYLYVAIAVSVALLVLLHRWIADAPRWLLRHNAIDRALQLLLESAAFNNRHLPLNLRAQLEVYAKQLQAAPAPSGYWAIWDGKTSRKYVIFIHLAWTGVAFMYNVMLVMIRSLGVQHVHVNTACMGFATMLGVFLGLYFILYTRRRWLWVGQLMIVAGALAYLIWLIPNSLKSNRRVGFKMIFWIFLQFATAASLSVLTICTGELVSADRRAMLMLSVSTFSRILLVIGPFIIITTTIHKLIPITVFATLAIFNGALMWALSRTFWNCEQPRIQKVLTPNTYRRNSAIALLQQRASGCSELGGGQLNPAFDENAYTISIPDLWQFSSRFDTIVELGGTPSEMMHETKFF